MAESPKKSFVYLAPEVVAECSVSILCNAESWFACIHWSCALFTAWLTSHEEKGWLSTCKVAEAFMLASPV